MPTNKERLDILLVERKLACSMSTAQALVVSGNVLVDDRCVDKVGQLVSIKSSIRLRKEPSRFVSRGGDKIESAIKHFNIRVEGKICLDIGASTGGFTDCLLQYGADKVYCVDVGYNQLDYKLRKDSRVVVMEKTHALSLRESDFSFIPQFVCIDVSFIGVRKVLSEVVRILKDDAEILVLVKPQFELEPQYVEKGGVVKNEKHRLLAVSLVREHVVSLGYRASEGFPCPIVGAKKGNQEYFILLEKG